MLLTGEDSSVCCENELYGLCFSYGVSSLIGNEESEPTGWFNIPVPPRFDETMRPILMFVVREKDSVVIEINNNVKNHRCQVRKA